MAAELYVGQIRLHAAQIPGNQLVPGLQATVRIPRQQSSLHVLRHIETKGRHRSVGGRHVRIVIALRQHVGRFGGLLGRVRERLEPPVRLAQIQVRIDKKLRVRPAAVEGAVVDADGHFAEQPAAPVRIGNALSGPREARRVDIFPDQRVRDAAGSHVRERFPAVAGHQVAPVEPVGQRLQGRFLHGERGAQRVLQVHRDAVRLAHGIQVAQDVEIAHRQRHAQAEGSKRLVVQLVLPEKTGGRQLARVAPEHQHEGPASAGLHVPEQGRLRPGLPVVRRRERQGQVHPAFLPVRRALVRGEKGIQPFRLAAARQKQAAASRKERQISSNPFHTIKSQCSHKFCPPPSPARSR